VIMYHMTLSHSSWLIVDGERLAKSTPIDVLLRQDFYMVINDLQYTASSPTASG